MRYNESIAYHDWVCWDYLSCVSCQQPHPSINDFSCKAWAPNLGEFHNSLLARAWCGHPTCGPIFTHGKSHKWWHRSLLVARCHYCKHVEDVPRNLCDQSLGFCVHIWILSSYWRRSLWRDGQLWHDVYPHFLYMCPKCMIVRISSVKRYCMECKAR